MMKRTKRKKIALIILGGILGMSFILYKPLINYLSEQAANPRGIIGEITTKIWSSYFADLSKWTISNTEMNEVTNVLDVGYGGGSNIKNLGELNQNITIYGVDISEESYKTATNLNKKAIDKGKVKLSIQDVAAMSYPADFFDVVYAIQTHMYWDNPRKGFEEIYRVMSKDAVLILSSEKDKIDYHMDKYKTTASLTVLLKEIGFSDVVEKEKGNWILYTIRK
ncbi:class I SAM-dependent methyltransferase [Listeria cossartiae subsp. cayugensis]|uniref:Class I SAM-dependent methyltransferase n=1 Tax=Listeria cossartiae subsp. cayugensis TaxID=2713505 RepID=A0ABU2IR97_9LIST|nr:class I SAM-dependent methyltransferase [Listeria cossartiae]EKZ4842211.1 class I SAM-dependent methyltransferase [Listeria monocytogenes]MDT0004511.1 class I SAM-dependent methyltransferase [Listeria cossartiae subsp. cayugensis]MDT0020930.1 class I SAM-dependent methyltransferase [Listeria cossartiae subsp. cayugensis]MDT0037336.1 class I SAM-dependent methyltransferase [Listeria cossartiae subsp. cayugensis]MDT0042656.1 class I SAM-dependent methyltransferase [Listeria cossartiae subsp. 